MIAPRRAIRSSSAGVGYPACSSRCRWSRGAAATAASSPSSTAVIARSPWTCTPICQPSRWAATISSRSSAGDRYIEPGELAVLAVRLGEGRRAADQRAVGVDLQRADPETIVPERTGEPQRAERLQLVGQRHADRAHAERAATAGLAVRGELAARHLCVADRGEPGGEEGTRRAFHGGDRRIQRRDRVEVRSVRADVDRDRQDQVHRGVQAPAVQPSVVTDEPAARWVRRRLVEAALRQRERVDDDVMTRDVIDADRPVGGGTIEIPSGQRRLVLRVVEAERRHPRAGRGGRPRRSPRRARGPRSRRRPDSGRRRAASDSPVARKWLCASIRPGSTVRPPTSICRASGNRSSRSVTVPTASMRAPR